MSPVVRRVSAQPPWPKGHGHPEEPQKNLAPKKEIAYRCAEGHTFTVAFHASAEAPVPWDCFCGSPAWLEDAPGGAEGMPQFPGYPTTSGKYLREKAPKTPLEHLHERRSKAELEELLAEFVDALRAQREAV